MTANLYRAEVDGLHGLRVFEEAHPDHFVEALDESGNTLSTGCKADLTEDGSGFQSSKQRDCGLPHEGKVDGQTGIQTTGQTDQRKDIHTYRQTIRQRSFYGSN
jgi:hypothetical protein